MDTLREKLILNKLWDKGAAPWKKNNSEFKNIYHLRKNVKQA